MGKYVISCDIGSNRVTSHYIICYITLSYMKMRERSAQTRMIVYKQIDQIHENSNEFSLSTLIRK